jgi:hypothetical protein
MIKINERFRINRYPFGWELHDTAPSMDKDGHPSLATRVTYHPNLKFVLRSVIDKSAGDCRELKEVIAHIDRVVKEFQNATAGVR